MFNTHSKSIENALGHLDNLLRQTGPQGFDKAIQAMQIAGAKDLVFDASDFWRMLDKRSRMAMSQLKSDRTES